MVLRLTIALAVVWGFAGQVAAGSPMRVGVFAVDATPPVGSPLAYAPAKEVTAPLSCRGVVLLGKDRPVVLCAVDWIGIGNDGQKAFRESLAKAAGTSTERVAVHALHQHCAPRCDFSTDRLLAQYGINHQIFDAAFARDVIRRAAEAVAVAAGEAKPDDSANSWPADTLPSITVVPFLGHELPMPSQDGVRRDDGRQFHQCSSAERLTFDGQEPTLIIGQKKPLLAL